MAAAKANGWQVVSMKRDWARVFRPADERRAASAEPTGAGEPSRAKERGGHHQPFCELVAKGLCDAQACGPGADCGLGIGVPVGHRARTVERRCGAGEPSERLGRFDRAHEEPNQGLIAWVGVETPDAAFS